MISVPLRLYQHAYGWCLNHLMVFSTLRNKLLLLRLSLLKRMAQIMSILNEQQCPKSPIELQCRALIVQWMRQFFFFSICVFIF